MIHIDGVTKRNICEQVQKNKDDIEALESGIVSPEFADILGNPYDNASLSNALNSKVDAESGFGLSEENFTFEEKAKLASINMASKQDVLSSAQIDATNSGITATNYANLTALANTVTEREWKVESTTPLTLTVTRDSVNKKTQLAVVGGSGVWGAISGNINAQTDLITELNKYVKRTALGSYYTKTEQNATDNAQNTEIAKKLEPSNIKSGSNITVSVAGQDVTIACNLAAMLYRGTVNTMSDLPASPSVGDVYGVRATNKIYVYTAGGTWDNIGSLLDASAYYTKTESDARYATKNGLTQEAETRQQYDNALGQDIENVDNTALHKNLDETVTGTKVFNLAPILKGGLDSYGTDNIRYSFEFPNKDGTVATTDDVFTVASDLGDEILARESGDADRYTKTESDNRYAQKATTLSGYGITDAYTKSETDNTFATQTALQQGLATREAVGTCYTKSDADATFLKLSGGTMTGSLGVNAGNSSIINSVDDNVLTICGGTDSDKGASLQLRGKDLASNPGWIVATASNGTNSPQLVAKPDGTFKWNNENVLTQKTSLPVLTLIDSSKWQLWPSVYSLGGNTYFMSITVRNISGSAQGSLDYPVVAISGIADDCCLATCCYEAPSTVIGAVIQTRSGGTDKVLKLRTNGAVIPNNAYIPICGVFRWTAA